MKNKEILIKIKRIAELFKEIRKDNNLVNQDLVRHAHLVSELRSLLAGDDIVEFTSAIEEILVLVDLNNGFTVEGFYKNPYMESIVGPVNKVAREYHEDQDKLIMILNEAHHENSQEFKTLNPDNPLPHCKENESEARYHSELEWTTDTYPVFEKNTTMGAFAPGYLDLFLIFPKLKRVRFAGGITDMCYLEAILPTRKFFDQHDMDIDVIATKELADTYDAPWHNRDEWTEMSYKFIAQAGIKLEKKYERGK